MKKSAIVIGSGFGGLGSACLLAKAGYDVTVLEKNEQLGGRAGVFSAKGFRFDMGPSWYLMPDVFENFFSLIGEDVNKHLKLKRLSPSYRIFFENGEKIDIYSDLKKDKKTLEKLEPGATETLREYLKTAKEQYEIAKDRFLYKNYDSHLDFMNLETLSKGRKLNALSNMDKYVKKHFETDEMYKLIQYPSVFLGSSPYATPALYSMMTHIDFNMGVFYPDGGITEITKALEHIAKKNGAKFQVNTGVGEILVEGGKAVGVALENGKKLHADVVVSNASVHHTETKLLPARFRTKSDKYFEKRTLAPSALILYLGVNKKYPSLKHHNLYFSENWKKNFAEIFDHPAWPENPSMYVCAPGKTDPTVAPKGKENLFVLVPIAPGLEYTEKQIEDYSDKILELLEQQMSLKDLRKNIIFKRIFSVKDFKDRYNSQDGTALGMAHILSQSASFRPSNTNKHVDNFYMVGADVNPGIGMPITLISAELMYKRLINDTSESALKEL
ncbi:MAG: phytoene desaturase family protein [bacterium]|nr:phytoene desaturase family protein [bacterium]